LKKNSASCYIIDKEDNRPQGGLPLEFGLKNRLVAANYRGGFSMSEITFCSEK
jgi:hypothetical protein